MTQAKRWEELLVYKLDGRRFDVHEGVQLRDLGGLYHLHTLLLELAKADFKKRLGRERSPKGADDLLDVRIRGFEDGCIQARVLLGREVQPPQLPTQTELFPTDPAPVEPTIDDEFLESVHNAAQHVERALAALVSGDSLPAWMPAETFSLLRSVVAASVRADERVTIKASRAPSPHAERDWESNVSAPVRGGVPPVGSVVAEVPTDQASAGSGPAEEPPPVGPEPIQTDVAPPLAEAARSAHSPRVTSTYDAASTRPTDALAGEPAPPPPPTIDKALLELLAKRSDDERRDREAAAAEAATRNRVLEGEVRMVDVDGRTLRLRVAGGPAISVRISSEHEREVTRALDKHESARLRVQGSAVHSPSGAVREILAERVAVVEQVASPTMGEEVFERLARQEPEQLLGLLRSDQLPPHLLTYAAEIAGGALRGDVVVEVLLRLLTHTEPVVREGAVYGLSGHLSDARVLARVKELREADPSAGVRAAADDTLEGR